LTLSKELRAMPGNTALSKQQSFLITVLAGLILAVPAAPALSQNFPFKPIRLIVPLAAGGQADLAGRTFGAKLAEIWGQQVLIDNRPGANTMIGAELAAKAPADGYTLFQPTGGTLVNNPLLYSKLPYDAKSSFALISVITTFPSIIVVHPALPANSVRDLVALSKARPAQLAYGTSGIGSAGHLAGALFETMAGVKLNHVPYKNIAQAISDTMSGQVPLMFTTFGSVGVHITNKKLKAIGVATAKRQAGWPGIPTVAEAGYPGFEMNGWLGIVAPAATPRAVIDRVHAGIVRVAGMRDVAERLQTAGLEVMTTTPEEFAAYIAQDRARVEKAVRAAGVKPE
jgi:tripartite-type tricarboxylate transporter receptor subunit TctC